MPVGTSETIAMLIERMRDFNQSPTGFTIRSSVVSVHVMENGPAVDPAMPIGQLIDMTNPTIMMLLNFGQNPGVLDDAVPSPLSAHPRGLGSHPALTVLPLHRVVAATCFNLGYRPCSRHSCRSTSGSFVPP